MPTSRLPVQRGALGIKRGQDPVLRAPGEQNDWPTRHDWKHNLPESSLTGGNNCSRTLDTCENNLAVFKFRKEFLEFQTGLFANTKQVLFWRFYLKKIKPKWDHLVKLN